MMCLLACVLASADALANYFEIGTFLSTNRHACWPVLLAPADVHQRPLLFPQYLLQCL
jgi:hypothetical protein